jgi:dihydroflavonol-4-reductase
MILITGASGLVGCALIKELYHQGVRHLRVLLHKNNAVDQLLRDEQCHDLVIDYVYGSVTDKESLYVALKNITHIYHLAGLISIVPGCYPALHRTNVLGVENLIEVAALCGAHKIVYISSIEAIGYIAGEKNINESVGFRPENTFMEYGKSKALGSLRALELAKIARLPLVVLAPGGILGPYDYGLSRLGKMIWDVSRGKLPAYINGGLDLADSRDIAHLCYISMQQAPAYQTYICSGSHFSLEHIIRLTAHIAQRKMPIKVAMPVAKIMAHYFEWQYRLGGDQPLITRDALRIAQASVCYDSSKAKQELAWQHRPLQETLAATITWFNTFYQAPPSHK